MCVSLCFGNSVTIEKRLFQSNACQLSSLHSIRPCTRAAAPPHSTRSNPPKILEIGRRVVEIHPHEQACHQAGTSCGACEHL
jgi:hypothetical protein